MGDHHEGPFSVGDIDVQVKQGHVTPQHFVWMEGMADWKMMSQIEDFTPTVKVTPPSPPTQSRNGAQVDLGTPSANVGNPELEEPSLVMTAPQTEQVFDQITTAPVVMDEKVFVKEAREKKAEKDEQEKKSNTFLKKLKKNLKFFRFLGSRLFLMLLLSGVLIWAFAAGQIGLIPGMGGVQSSVVSSSKKGLKQAAKWIPGLGNFIWSIPLNDAISEKDFDRLNDAAASNFVRDGIRLEIALERGDSRSPRIFIASNLPDDTILGVYVKGVRGTLLNHFGFTRTLEVKLKNKTAATEPLKFVDGRPIPQGQYIVYVFDGPRQLAGVNAEISNLPRSKFKLPKGIPGGNKTVSSEILFLGGAKDKDYVSRLRKFHQRIRKKARNEIGQLKQFAVTVTSQFQSTNFQFIKISRIRSEKTKNNRWNKFSYKWLSFYRHLTLNFKNWTNDRLTNDYFYSDLHRDLRFLALNLGSLHKFYSEWVVETNPQVRNRLMSEIKKKEKEYRSEQDRLKNRILVAEKNFNAEKFTGRGK